MFKNIVILIIALSPILCQVPYMKYDDRVAGNDKHRVKVLANLLISESKYKIKQTDPLRDEFGNRIGFHIGTMIGYIREKYKTMLEIYRQSYNKYTKRAKLILPRVPHLKPIIYMLRYEIITSLEVDIDRLVHILETIPNETHGIRKKHHRRAGGYEYDSTDISNYRTKLFKKLQLNP